MMKTKTDNGIDRGRKGKRKVERGKVRARDRRKMRKGWQREHERDRVLVEGPRIFGGRRLRVSMGTVTVRPLFRKTPMGEKEEGICPIPTHSRPLFSHSISFCHCSFSAPWWAHSEGDPPRQPPSQRTLFLLLAFRRPPSFRRLFLSWHVYAESRVWRARTMTRCSERNRENSNTRSLE